jgi:hypothetical protein
VEHPGDNGRAQAEREEQRAVCDGVFPQLRHAGLSVRLQARVDARPACRPGCRPGRRRPRDRRIGSGAIPGAMLGPARERLTAPPLVRCQGLRCRGLRCRGLRCRGLRCQGRRCRGRMLRPVFAERLIDGHCHVLL